MNKPLPADKLRSLHTKMAAYNLLLEREKQSQRGGLIEFVRYFWDVLEPETPFVEGWPMIAICYHLEAIAFGDINRLLMVVPPGFAKSILTDCFFPAWMWSALDMPSKRIVAFSYSASLTERDNERFRALIMSDKFQELWGDKFKLEKIGESKVSNNKTGWKRATSVGGVGTGERGNLVILDDPHSIKQVESAGVREETVRWFREAMSNRLNDMQADAIVIIMQRSHDADVAGVIFSENLPYVVLSIEMEFDSTRETAGVPNEIGWVDPREAEGELAWPTRFPGEVCNDLRKTIGIYAWCNPGEAPVLMADLSFKRIDEVKVGDEVVGFEIGNDQKRARLKPAKVLSISKSMQPVVRMMLDSEHVIRCTPNHKWFTGRNDKSHPPYAPVHLGSVVKRVCPPELPKIADDETSRLAGWLSGFFDGEGSVTLTAKSHGKRISSLISFTQSAEQNLPICEKLEMALSQLGFEYGCMERQPTALSAAGIPWQKRRSYYLRSDAGKGVSKSGPLSRMSRLTLNQRFLHVVQPTKWRQRLIDATVNGRMYTSTERVLSIKPDGTDLVYGLETTTGNYVVWGLASSNSSQYQQNPVPRGGGILRREWWKPWDNEEAQLYGLEWAGARKEFPHFELVFGSLDTAYGLKEENAYSALTIWGVFLDRARNRRLMLAYAWKKRVQLHGVLVDRIPGEAEVNWRARQRDAWGLVELVADTCRRYKVQRLLIEDKSNGRDVASEIVRLYVRENWGVELLGVAGDKVSRAHAVVPIFADGCVYSPDTKWAEMVMMDCQRFPKGTDMDIVDTCTQAINWARTNGLIERSDETSAALEDEAAYGHPQQTVAQQYGV